MTSVNSNGLRQGWVLYLSVYAAGLVSYTLIPTGLVSGACFQLFAWSGVVMMAVRLGRTRPQRAGALWLLTGWQALEVLGSLILTALAAPASPAPQDIAYLLGYVLGIAGTIRLLRHRVPGRNRESLLDAAVISCGFALLSSVFLVKPAVLAAGSSSGAVVLAAYPLMDLFLLALLIRLLLAGGLHSGAMRLIALTQLTCLLSNSAWALIPQIAAQNELTYRIMAAGSLLVFGIFGAAALHPDITAVANTPVQPDQRNSRLRTPLLWTAVMSGPALLLFEAWRNHLRVPDAVAIATGCVVIFGLVVARMQTLVTRVHSQSALLTSQAEDLRVLASHDGLTGLINRRAWDDALADGLQAAARHNYTTAIVMIDLDRFKSYNDTFGHPAGDRLLKGAAAAWAGQFRQTDVLARYGGEEFIALLPGCDAEGATEVIARLQAATPDGQTFSAGVAIWDTAETGDELIARADAALYQAKNAGRNRAVIAATTVGVGPAGG